MQIAELAGACQSLSTHTKQSPFNITLANNYWRQTFLRYRKPWTLIETLRDHTQKTD